MVPSKFNYLLLLADKQQIIDAMLSANQDLRCLALEGTPVIITRDLLEANTFSRVLYEGLAGGATLFIKKSFPLSYFYVWQYTLSFSVMLVVV